MPNKKNGKSSMDYYRENKESYEKKKAAQKKINARPEERKKRSELVKINRQKGTVGDGKDVAHQKGGKTILQDQSKNRGSKSAMPGDRRSRGGGKKK